MSWACRWRVPVKIWHLFCRAIRSFWPWSIVTPESGAAGCSLFFSFRFGYHIAIQRYRSHMRACQWLFGRRSSVTATIGRTHRPKGGGGGRAMELHAHHRFEYHGRGDRGPWFERACMCVGDGLIEYWYDQNFCELKAIAGRKRTTYSLFLMIFRYDFYSMCAMCNLCIVSSSASGSIVYVAYTE